MCFGGDGTPPVDPNAKKPVSPLTTTPTPDRGAPDVIAARMRERQQLDSMAGYRSTFVSGPRGPGGPSLADQRAQLDTTSALPTTTPVAPDAGTETPPPPNGDPGTGGGPGDGSQGGDPGGNTHALLTFDRGNGTTQPPDWWKPPNKRAGAGFYAE